MPFCIRLAYQIELLFNNLIIHCRLINLLTNREVSQTLRINDEDQVLQKVTEDLAHVEDMLDDCLSSLTHYTGKKIVSIYEWALEL